MHTADANAAALPPNAHYGPCNLIGAGSVCAANTGHCNEYPGKSYAEPRMHRAAILA